LRKTDDNEINSGIFVKLNT